MMKLSMEIKDENQSLNKKFEHVIDKQGKIIAEQGHTIKNIQKNLVYVTQQLNQRPQGGLSIDTVPNPKGKKPCCFVTLRSGKVLNKSSKIEVGEPSRSTQGPKVKKKLRQLKMK